MGNGFRSFADLVLVLLLGAVAAWAIATDVGFGPLRVLFGIAMVLFLPGYVLAATLYPGRAATERDADRARALDGLERAVLSVLLSVCVVPLLAFAADVTGLGVSREPVLGLVVAWIGVFAVAATVARLRLPADRQFRVEGGGSLAAVDGFLRKQSASLRSTSPFAPQNDAELLLNALVAAGVLLLVASVGFTAVADPGNESFTELYLLSENEDGELVAEGFETEYAGDESVPVTVAVANHEGDRAEYTGVVTLQRLSSNGTTVEAEDEIGRFEATVPDGETVRIEPEATPSMTGENLRLRVLLYDGEVPNEPSADSAYRTVHLDVTVEG
ncbi:hypothetical protein DJ82_04095 [Halorubrum sp. Ib24]|uniref:DUF1616 domain-containing protein n=1 Tax=unclassified Halorubrum TaxID=2642239 RepID=UPI000B999DD2|nr:MULTISPECIES: DUF1616 domain-containing protein [unclassified Halorubrum]OYR39208.1 hypothetical protein DJ75_17215 [Halorubrum sp. Eb13]OYR41817.1 hypothetical protein DJ82_04095 [Halorubrum sp. Ib24]